MDRAAQFKDKQDFDNCMIVMQTYLNRDGVCVLVNRTNKRHKTKKEASA